MTKNKWICPKCKQETNEIYADEQTWIRFTHNFEQGQYIDKKILGIEQTILTCPNCLKDLVDDERVKVKKLMKQSIIKEETK